MAGCSTQEGVRCNQRGSIHGLSCLVPPLDGFWICQVMQVRGIDSMRYLFAQHGFEGSRKLCQPEDEALPHV